MKTKLEKAVETLCEALAEDKSEGSYYYTWQANIAMAFQDLIVYNSFHAYGILEERKVDNICYYTREDIHKISNQAAKNFLDLLISK